jgi:hypothetical protein
MSEWEANQVRERSIFNSQEFSFPSVSTLTMLMYGSTEISIFLVQTCEERGETFTDP